ncbi:MAG TPA: CinA family protein [Candidatus Limnocylindrales bacterium]|nr:CinA family protein [Candidatus Limnocylindrales bacterium]
MAEPDAPAERRGPPASGQVAAPAEAGDAAAPDTLAPLVELARGLLERCTADGSTVGTAESCTAGLIGHLLTETPGASAVFRGGIISYSDAVKGSLLAVPADVLAAHGAVSAQVAVAMARGARRALEVDLALAVTGIAGPDGGTARKPVGLTYVAVADAAGEVVRRHQWAGDRSANKVASAGAALALALERLDARPAG